MGEIKSNKNIIYKSSDDEYFEYVEKAVFETPAKYYAGGEFNPKIAAYRYFNDFCFSTGSTYLPYENLTKDRRIEKYGLSFFDICEIFDDLVDEGTLEALDIFGSRRYYLPNILNCEYNIAQRLSNIKKTLNKKKINYENYLEIILSKKNIKISEMQSKALVTAFNEKVTIITGPPGSGKTTLIELICYVLDENNCSYNLCAYTGKAASRLTEVTGKPASTIHRLLKFRIDEGSFDEIENTAEYVGKDESDPIISDYIIIDEMSMLDTDLFSALLSAVTYDTSLILLGDSFQLPSIRQGNVLYDLMNSNCFECVKLDHFFRQYENYGLIEMADNIINKNHLTTNEDFILFEYANLYEITEKLYEIVSEKKNCLPQIISAYKTASKTFGIENLNIELKKILNPLANENIKGFYVGDRVIVKSNNYNIKYKKDNVYEFGVFNGETGYIKDIDVKENIITVLFNESKEVVFKDEEINILSLAYAITIHKSQGSEYDEVIVILGGYSDFVTQNMLYTALTRAKTKATLITLNGVVDKIYKNQTLRYTSLKEIIQDEIYF